MQMPWLKPGTTDYYATVYSAEIVNTLTNLLFQYLAFKGILSCIQNRHDTVFLVTFVGYLLVGTGSFLFHMTLKYPMQLVDELSMIYTTCLMCYATFSYGKSRRYSVLLAFFLVSLCIFITGYYHYLQDPAFHQNAYALLTAVVLFRSIYVMEVSLRPSRQAHRTSQKAGSVSAELEVEHEWQDRRDEAILRRMWLLIGYGLTIFLGGFFIWTLDNEMCSTLRIWRRHIGLPWGVLLEGHGWWHLMTGIGAYFYITWGIWLRHCLNGKQDQYELRWPRVIGTLPTIVRRKSVVSNGLQNGAVKKHM
ncbi:hypothetical protein B0A49_05353 [Cryomyces minteri]|uniref:Alkaline ceramidase 3 n=1 Tax=Cryomyces minteri TaxID=331657 RepID=A0A4U0X1N8_9PEZI|nr:hypothetical protein B0A49_05353 [Cryomyces minteri]